MINNRMKNNNSANKKKNPVQYAIPKGYKGIKQDLQLNLTTNLAVITGLNGSGKTTVLQFIYENYSLKSKVFFKSQSISHNTDKHSYGRYRYTSYRDQKRESIPTFESVMDKVYELFDRSSRHFYRHDTEVFSMLFDSTSILYDEGYDFLKELSRKLSYLENSQDNIKRKLGVPLKEEITKEIVKRINKSIKTNSFNNMSRKGKTLYEKYQNDALESKSDCQNIDRIKEESESFLRKNLREKSRIKDRQTFEDYLHELVMNFSFSIESIVEKLSKRMYEDAKAKGFRVATYKMYDEINKLLDKYREMGAFRYRIRTPSAYSSSYEFNFIDPEKDKVFINFNSLSSGEKVIFELICYYFVANKNGDLELIILDEFDSNLNPSLTETYLNVIREEFCKKNITAILTTHSPSTVAEVKPQELFELQQDSQESSQIIKWAENNEGKKKILRKLAPNFIYHSEFGGLEYILKGKEDSQTIVLVEGKNDIIALKRAPESKEFLFIDCSGAGNIKNFIVCLQALPFLNEIVKNKLVIGLYDFDDGGIKEIKDTIEGTEVQEILNKVDINKPAFIKTAKYQNLSLYLSILHPSDNKSHNHYTPTKPYRHQNLKGDPEGLTRQIKLLKEIRNAHKKLLSKVDN